MAHRFSQLTFTPSVVRMQEQFGTAIRAREVSQRMPEFDRFSQREVEFIQARDSFYMASVSEDGWPYIQHRGGPVGFLKVIDQLTIGFADYSGNRQYITTGNVLTNDRVALFLMDYPNRKRLKLLGHMVLAGSEQKAILEQLHDGDYKAPVERGMIIRVEAFDWNCPQHITPRYTQAEVEALLESMHDGG